MNLNKIKHYSVLMVVLVTLQSLWAQNPGYFVTLATEHNLSIQKLEVEHHIATEKVNEVHSLPNTTFGAGYFVSEPETRTGPQQFKLSVSQMFPWFGTNKSKENYQNALVAVAYEDVAIAKRKVAFDVVSTYCKLFALYEKQQIIQQNLSLLSTYETLATDAIITGKAAAVDVLKLQLKQNDLQNKLTDLKTSYYNQYLQFKKILNTNDSISIQWPENFYNYPTAEEVVDTSLLRVHPELIKFDKLYESVTQSNLVNEKEKRPTLGVGLDYIGVGNRSDMVVTDNGKDIIMPMVSVSIPIFNKKYTSKTKQLKLQQQQLEIAKKERLLELETLLQDAIATRNNALHNYDSNQKNIIKTQDIEVLLRTAFENGKANVQDLLDVQQLQLDYQLKQVDTVLQYYLQTVIIHYLCN